MPHRWILGAALAAALGGAFPAAAAVNGSARLAPAGAVARFYEARQNPLWSQSPDAIAALRAGLRSSIIDGFADGPDLDYAIGRALADAEAGIPGAASEAERLLSSAFVLYAQALRWPGPTGTVFADPALAPRVPTPAQVLEAAATAPDLAAHVRATLDVNPIHAALRAAAIEDLRFLGIPGRALEASLARARLLPSSGRLVLVDIASQELMMIEDGREVDRMKVIVGRPEMKTPLLAGTLRQVTLNPYWNVPVDLAQKNIAPQVLRHGTGWLDARNYEVLSGWTPDAVVVDPATVDWQAVADRRQEVRVRQRPGPGNSMGEMKFQFPNELGIYLHDTPDRALFAESRRTFSAGCIRLEDAARLGRWLLGRAPVPSTDRPEYQVALKEAVPVFLTYLSVRPAEHGGLTHAPDVYGLDRPGAAALAAAN